MEAAHRAILPPPYRLPRLRFMTCGAVDDGKSTLLGRLLYDCGAIYEDQLDEIRQATSAAMASGLDFAFVVDGLKAEREQGITIDVAYRYFATARRAFICADAPGHEQYTRNQAAAASQSDIAVVVVSIVDGIREQTRRHMVIGAMFGIQEVIVAVTKMDIVRYDESRFRRIEQDVSGFCARLGIRARATIPVSAKGGDNILAPLRATSWYGGPTLLEALESCEPRSRMEAALRLPVQMTARLSNGGRVSLGTISSGRLIVGDRVCTTPALPATVTRLWQSGRESREAHAGEAVAVQLTPEIDIGRGMVLLHADAFAESALQLHARLVWLDTHPMMHGRDYDCLIGHAKVAASVSRVKGIVDLDQGSVKPADRAVVSNDIAEVTMSFAQAIFASPFAEDPRLGSFIMVDRQSRRSVAAGIVTAIERRAGDLPWQTTSVTSAARAAAKLQKPFVLWFTGLSGAGKSTLCDLLEQRLHALGRHTMILDGDNLRHGLNADLGFGDVDRVENMRRVAHVARLLAEAGIITLVSLISPFRAERQRAREVVGAERFLEIFVDAPLDVCRQRDPKGLYARASSGKLSRFTGISASYEEPLKADIHLRTDQASPVEAVDAILRHLRQPGGLLA